MRLRTPSFIWIPFVFSVGTISWGLLAAGLVLFAAVILTPAIRDVKEAEKTRNDYQATLDLLEQKIALQKDFADKAGKDLSLMERLASLQLNLNRKDQDILILDPQGLNQDRSVRTLLAKSLKPVPPVEPKPLNPLLAMTLNPGLRSMLIMLACAAMGLSFFLGVKYERHRLPAFGPLVYHFGPTNLGTHLHSVNGGGSAQTERVDH